MREKGKLKKWLKSKGKNSLGVLLDTVGEAGVIPLPFINGIMEKIGEGLQDDPKLSAEDKAEGMALIKEEHAFIIADQAQITDRWKSDNEQDLKLPKLIRPMVLAYSWVVITLLLILEACNTEIVSASLIIGMITTVNVAYFGSRGYEKVIQYKNKNK